MTVKNFDEKKLNKKIFWELYIPTTMKVLIWFGILRYLVFLEILKASTVPEIKLTTIGIVGVYLGIETYRVYLEKVLPLVGVSLEEVDNLIGQLFPKKKKFWWRDKLS